MIRRIATTVLLLALQPSLVSVAPAPLPLATVTHPPLVMTVVPRGLRLPTAPAPRPAAVIAPSRQDCTYDHAATRLSQQVADPAGYPFGEVTAWACGAPQAAWDEFNARLAAMQAQAAAYRATHPIT